MCSEIKKAAAFFVFLALIFQMPAHAQTISELKTQIDEKNKDIERLEAEIKEYQENIDEAESTAKTLNEAIKRLDSAIKKLNTQIKLTQNKIAKEELEIKSLNLGIGETESSISDRKANMRHIIDTMRETELEDPISRFFKYSTLAEFFGELEKIKALEESLKANHDNLVALKLGLETERAKAENAKKELERLRGNLNRELELDKDNKNEKAALLKATKNQEALYQKLLKDREKKRAEIYEDIRRIETELRKKIDLASLPQFGRGVLLVPIDGGALTQEFGQTTFSRNTDVYNNGFHNGVDFRASVGTPIKAADIGVVKATGNTDSICPRGSYGKWVLIEHPNKLSTLYAHLSSIKLTQGQNVQRGDIIGYSGNTGYTTGPHLHFTVYDARTVQLRQSRVCGVLPYGGYLDPANYL